MLGAPCTSVYAPKTVAVSGQRFLHLQAMEMAAALSGQLGVPRQQACMAQQRLLQHAPDRASA
jgi:hypothetical protein